MTSLDGYWFVMPEVSHLCLVQQIDEWATFMNDSSYKLFTIDINGMTRYRHLTLISDAAPCLLIESVAC